MGNKKRLEKLKLLAALPPSGYSVNLSDPHWLMKLKLLFKKLFKKA